MDQNDVNTQTDTSTETGSSPDQQTPTDQAATQESSGAQAAGDKTVPYERFKEVNDSFRQTQAELKAIREEQQKLSQTFTQSQQVKQPDEVIQAKEQLKNLLKEVAPDLGFVSKQEIEQQQQNQAVANTEQKLSEKYSGKDGMPKYDAETVRNYAIKMGYTKPEHLEVAYKQMHEAEIMNARIAQAMQQTRGVRSETSNGTGSANAGVSNDDLLKASQEGDKAATHLLIKRRLFKQ